VPEQATGHSEPTGENLAGERIVLVVDLDGELLAPLRAAEEVLLTIGLWEDDDWENPPADGASLRLPTPLASRVALAAVRRLLTTLAPTQSRGPRRGRLLVPVGCLSRTVATSTRR
jgi:hypothetical protein